jgi:hypothetical protein
MFLCWQRAGWLPDYGGQDGQGQLQVSSLILYILYIYHFDFVCVHGIIFLLPHVVKYAPI